MREFIEGGIVGLGVCFLAGAFVTADWSWASGVMSWRPPDRAFLLLMSVLMFGLGGAIANLIRLSCKRRGL